MWDQWKRCRDSTGGLKTNAVEIVMSHHVLWCYQYGTFGGVSLIPGGGDVLMENYPGGDLWYVNIFIVLGYSIV